MANDGLRAIASAVAACRACPRLVAWREEVARTKRPAFADDDYWARGVPGFGDPRAAVMVVGLAPAAHGANRTGRMFTGDRSGDWLFAALHRAGFANQPTSTHCDDGLVLANAWVTAPVRCAPPANKPAPDERDACAKYLAEEIRVIDPRVFVALGQFAWDAVCRLIGWHGHKPRFGHGAEAELADERTLVGCYHVSQQNTFTGRLTEEMLDSVFHRARRLAGLERGGVRTALGAGWVDGDPRP